MIQYRVRLFTAALVAMMALSGADAFAQQRPRNQSFNVVPILIQNVTINTTGQLVANGLVGTTPFASPITLTPQAVPGAACNILNLTLGPINLDLLGLNVDTSPICLDITAVPGSGALLGNLLCAIAGLLDPTGSNQAAVLAARTPEEKQLLDRGLTQLLNQAVFIPLSNSDASITAVCNVLSLAIGPVDLNLLGLRVELDDCDNGPVTVDITADPTGGLLGNLLCGLANLLNNPFTQNAAMRLLAIISAIMGALVA